MSSDKEACILLGDWLKIKANYDKQICKTNGWECVQKRHYDAIINKKRVEIKKTKSSSSIIKLQQLAEIFLDESLQDIEYLVIRTTSDQEDVHSAYLVPVIYLLEIFEIDKERAESILDMHKRHKATIQCPMTLSSLSQFKITEPLYEKD